MTNDKKYEKPVGVERYAAGKHDSQRPSEETRKQPEFLVHCYLVAINTNIICVPCTSD